VSGAGTPAPWSIVLQGALAHRSALCSRLYTTPHVRRPPPGPPIAIPADFPALLTDGEPGLVGSLCRPTPRHGSAGLADCGEPGGWSSAACHLLMRILAGAGCQGDAVHDDLFAPPRTWMAWWRLRCLQDKLWPLEDQLLLVDMKPLKIDGKTCTPTRIPLLIPETKSLANLRNRTRRAGGRGRERERPASPCISCTNN
jgi:hypothetical protein